MSARIVSRFRGESRGNVRILGRVGLELGSGYLGYVKCFYFGLRGFSVIFFLGLSIRDFIWK